MPSSAIDHCDHEVAVEQAAGKRGKFDNASFTRRRTRELSRSEDWLCAGKRAMCISLSAEEPDRA